MKAHRLSLIILSLLVAISLSGCGLFKPKTITVYESVPVYPELQSPPKPLELLPVSWSVVSDENLNFFLTENRTRNGGTVFIALEVRDYENLSHNMAEMQRFVIEQRAIIRAYETRPSFPEIDENGIPETTPPHK